MILALLLAGCAPECKAVALFPDEDGDGWGDTRRGLVGCGGEAGWILDGGDCDDRDAAVLPGGEDAWYDGVDGDCDGRDDFDQDGDGRVVDIDCDDTDPAVHPGAAESWYDGVDQDCDGNDADRDGDGADWPADCDDADPTVLPGAADAWYDGVDGDCDERDDFDQDGDGVDVTLDCDDTDPGVHPQAEEVCGDGVDQDCDGVGCGLEGQWNLGAAGSTFVGEAATGRLGQRFAGGRDLDGDGALDLALTEAGAGRVWLVPAASAGAVDEVGVALDGFTADESSLPLLEVAVLADALLVGDFRADAVTRFATPVTDGARFTGDGAGYRMADAGDLDDDGLADALVAWPLDPRDTVDGDCVAVLLGGASAGPLEDAGPAWCGAATGDYASRPGAGDLDGDGLTDGIVGAPGRDVDAGIDGGAVYVLLAPGAGDIDLADADARIDGDHAGDAAGSPVSAAGDLDGDGRDDVLLLVAGEDVFEGDDGAAYVFLSVRDATVDEADVVLTGSRSLVPDVDQVAYVGDLDGDGRDDLAAASLSEYGYVFAFPGLDAGSWTYADATVRWFGDIYGDAAGTALGPAGDVDGDGFDDALIGAPEAADADDEARGRVYVVRGAGGW